MASSCVMKQIHEKHVATELCLYVWSPKMDLLAIANASGEVVLHRLSWQKVWTLAAESDTVKVLSLAWRPDSKVLAAGFSSGLVKLVNVEDGSVIHELSFSGQVTCVYWTSHDTEPKDTDCAEEDLWMQYTYPLPELGRTVIQEDESDSSYLEPQLLKGQNAMTILAIGINSGILHLYAFGLFHVGSYQLNHSESVVKFVSIEASTDMSQFKGIIECISEDNSRSIELVTFQTDLISTHTHEIAILSKKYGQIHSLMSYIKHTMSHLDEAFETALLEIDAKLESYASQMPEGGVSADFLNLLVFGFPSPELEIFLTLKLTDKSLKKLRVSVETSYTNMQKLIARNLKTIGLTLILILSHITGMARLRSKYERLGINENCALNAMKETGRFLLKAGEMLQVIDGSLQDFQNFLKWLTYVKCRYVQDVSPREAGKITSNELNSTIDFLNDFFEVSYVDAEGNRHTKFQLERVGQYMKNENLKTLHPSTSTPWIEFLNSCPQLKNNPHIYSVRSETSLVQEFRSLEEVLLELSKKPSNAMQSQIKYCSTLKLLQTSNSLHCSQMANQKQGFVYTAFIPPDDRFTIFILRNCVVNPDLTYVAKYNFTQSDRSFSEDFDATDRRVLLVIDVQFYNQCSLALLLQDANDVRSVSYAQLGLDYVLSDMVSLPTKDIENLSCTDLICKDASQYFDSSCYRKLDVGASSAFSVSGDRKVAAIIGDNKRRIKVYEMEVDDDEDEDTTLESITNYSMSKDN